MIDVRPFMPGDLVGFKAQAAQSSELNAEALQDGFGIAWTALVDARPIACAGLVEIWNGRAYAWALLSEDAGPHMLPLTREIRSRLAETPWRRLEMAVADGFEPGRRWAQLLGFSCETPQPMQGFLPDGRAAWLYARVKNGSSPPVHDVQHIPDGGGHGDQGRGQHLPVPGGSGRS